MTRAEQVEAAMQTWTQHDDTCRLCQTNEPRLCVIGYQLLARDHPMSHWLRLHPLDLAQETDGVLTWRVGKGQSWLTR